MREGACQAVRNGEPLKSFPLSFPKSFDGATWKVTDEQQAFFKGETLPHVSTQMIKCVGPAGDYERLKTCQKTALNTDAGEKGFDSDVLSKEA